LKHHFTDFLDREGGYWTIIPNRERYEYVLGNISVGNKDIKIVTVGRDDADWEKIFTLTGLEELTLHEPSADQLQSISRLWTLKRLRITHARPKNIDFMSKLVNIEELVLEYVSGFSDLAPLRSLSKLRALHIENLRQISNFDGLVGLKSLKYLYIDGTLDWKQPIANFEFLSGLPNLEVLRFGQIINKSPFPALLPVLSLKHLKKLFIARSMLATNEYALLQVGLPKIEGTQWAACDVYAYRTNKLPQDDIRSRLPEDVIRAKHPEINIRYDGSRFVNDPDSEWFEFLGKGAGRVKCSAVKAQARCDEFIEKYELMKNDARKVIANNKDGN
jgi:hypothetical protein